MSKKIINLVYIFDKTEEIELKINSKILSVNFYKGFIAISVLSDIDEVNYQLYNFKIISRSVDIDSFNTYEYLGNIIDDNSQIKYIFYQKGECI